MHPERDAAAERCPVELAVDLVLVEAVAGLVHRGEEPVKAVVEVACGDADVVAADRRREGVHGRVEPPRRLVEAETAHDLELELLLPLDREHLAGRWRLALGGRQLLDEGRLLLFQVVEDRSHLGRRQAALEVVEEGVVGLGVVALEAGDVAAAQLEVLTQRREEAREVVVLACLDPDGERERGRPRHLGPQLGRHLARLLEVLAGHRDQARLERVGVVLGREGGELVEQAADLGRDELVVDDPAERRELLGPGRRTARRHHHVLVPAEQRGGAGDVADLGQSLAQLFERGGHRAAP